MQKICCLIVREQTLVWFNKLFKRLHCVCRVDYTGAAAHKDDRAMSVFLEPVQKHDLHQAADMQARRGAVEADIACDRSVTLFRLL